MSLPRPEEPCLAFFVREAWPAGSYAAGITEGRLEDGTDLLVTSGLDDGGVVFGDGIEADRLEFRWGVTARIRVAQERLRLVAAAT